MPWILNDGWWNVSGTWTIDDPWSKSPAVYTTATFKRIVKQYHPLNKGLILLFSGVSSQVYDSAEKEYYPDRSMVPLVITPLMSLKETRKNTITYAESESDYVNYSLIESFDWYKVVNGKEVKIEDSDTDFSINRTETEDKGTISIFQNTPVKDSLTLSFRCNVRDPRNSSIIPFSDRCTLTTSESNVGTVFLQLDMPNGNIINKVNPQADSFIINASLKSGSYDLERTRYWWYFIDDKGVSTLLDQSVDNVTISGGKLTVPLEFVGYIARFKCYAEQVSAIQLVEAGRTPSPAAVSAEFALSMRLPRFYYDIITPLTVSETQETFDVYISAKTSAGAIPSSRIQGQASWQNPILDELFNIRWFYSNASTAKKEFASGWKTPVNCSLIDAGGNLEIDAEIEFKITPKRKR